MKVVKAKDLDENFFASPVRREASQVKEILAAVREKGDRAISRYTEIFDGVRLQSFRIKPAEIRRAGGNMKEPLKSAVEFAASNIRKFAQKQLSQFKDFEYEVQPGVFCRQRVVPLDRVGVYVPGGRFPLFSSLLMGVIPAQVAGVREIAVCSPPSHLGSVHPSVLGVASLLGIKEIYSIGGVQAIGALAYGTETIQKVDKIVGPGNRFVALAKKEVFGETGIDLPAGPSEIVILADQNANPRFLAADLLAQAEHDLDAVCILITDSQKIAEKVLQEIHRQLALLPTAAVAEMSLKKNGRIILVESLEEAVSICNRKAPEHLEIHARNRSRLEKKLRHFGTLFSGEWALEVLGDYSSGLNHILPTGSSARYSSGLSVQDFVRLQTTLQVRSDGIRRIVPAARIIADGEGLFAHAASVNLRLQAVSGEKAAKRSGAGFSRGLRPGPERKTVPAKKRL
ncbi:MAG: histidinol dehydrogenase [Candidatus Aminicenantales bacterium]